MKKQTTASRIETISWLFIGTTMFFLMIRFREISTEAIIMGISAYLLAWFIMNYPEYSIIKNKRHTK